jgi:hypothetical protein
MPTPESSASAPFAFLRDRLGAGPPRHRQQPQNLALVLRDQGDLLGARNYLERAFRIRETVWALTTPTPREAGGTSPR